MCKHQDSVHKYYIIMWCDVNLIRKCLTGNKGRHYKKNKHPIKEKWSLIYEIHFDMEPCKETHLSRRGLPECKAKIQSCSWTFYKKIVFSFQKIPLTKLLVEVAVDEWITNDRRSRIYTQNYGNIIPHTHTNWCPGQFITQKMIDKVILLR